MRILVSTYGLGRESENRKQNEGRRERGVGVQGTIWERVMEEGVLREGEWREKGERGAQNDRGGRETN